MQQLQAYGVVSRENEERAFRDVTFFSIKHGTGNSNRLEFTHVLVRVPIARTRSGDIAIVPHNIKIDIV